MKYNALVKVRVHLAYSKNQQTSIRRRAKAAGTDIRTVVLLDAKRAINGIPELTYHDTTLRVVRTAGKVGGFQTG